MRRAARCGVVLLGVYTLVIQGRAAGDLPPVGPVVLTVQSVKTKTGKGSSVCYWSGYADADYTQMCGHGVTEVWEYADVRTRDNGERKLCGSADIALGNGDWNVRALSGEAGMTGNDEEAGGTCERLWPGGIAEYGGFNSQVMITPIQKEEHAAFAMGGDVTNNGGGAGTNKQEENTDKRMRTGRRTGIRRRNTEGGGDKKRRRRAEGTRIRTSLPDGVEQEYGGVWKAEADRNTEREYGEVRRAEADTNTDGIQKEEGTRSGGRGGGGQEYGPIWKTEADRNTEEFEGGDGQEYGGVWKAEADKNMEREYGEMRRAEADTNTDGIQKEEGTRSGGRGGAGQEYGPIWKTEADRNTEEFEGGGGQEYGGVWKAEADKNTEREHGEVRRAEADRSTEQSAESGGGQGYGEVRGSGGG
ncbi:hypothetical protein DFP72DRAFT_863506 [Ephemerocybe angulata]|nr:hypothetical protein DFP72DRAFT_863506 [Tulosesus angulatus]